MYQRFAARQSAIMSRVRSVRRLRSWRLYAAIAGPIRNCQEGSHDPSVSRPPPVAATRGKAGAARERPAPLRQAVYDALVEMIITRELQPGAASGRNELAAQLGVSRQPVREALQRMQSEGWVDLRPALGAFVHIPTEYRGRSASRRAHPSRGGVRQAGRTSGRHRSRSSTSGSSNAPARRRSPTDDQEGLVAANASLHAASSRCPATRFLPISSGRSTAGCGGTTCPSPRRGRKTPGTNTPN